MRSYAPHVLLIKLCNWVERVNLKPLRYSDPTLSIMGRPNSVGQVIEFCEGKPWDTSRCGSGYEYCEAQPSVNFVSWLEVAQVGYHIKQSIQNRQVG